MGDLSEESLSGLSLVGDLVKNIQVSATCEPNGDVTQEQYYLSYYAPKFLWILRDFKG
jgi:hypothetical protein